MVHIQMLEKPHYLEKAYNFHAHQNEYKLQNHFVEDFGSEKTSFLFKIIINTVLFFN
jgi:hypothetical protein